MLVGYNEVAVIRVDVQNDFCAGGALEVPGALEIIDPLNALHRWVASKYGISVVTRDWHPTSTDHFNKWPVHCVSGTPGAEFHPLLDIRGSIIVSKGTSVKDDGYSGFEGRAEDGRYLNEILPSSGRLALIIGGLATDYCVKATVLDAIKLAGVDVFVPRDCVRAVSSEQGEVMLRDMKNGLGVTVCDAKDISLGGLINVAGLRRKS
jgi:nicotinamidase/pyrazinamidase